MSIRVRVCALFLGVIGALCAWGHQALAAEDARPPRTEDMKLSVIAPHMSGLELTPQARELRIPFTIAPGAEPSGVELILSASPLSDAANGQIEVLVNRSRAAASAAANRVPRRRNYTSTAFADDTTRSARVTGMAALFEDTGGRRIALITAPEGADFSRAAARLARSGLWTGLEGRAVVWDAAAVTSFGPSASPRFSAVWISDQIRRHDRWIALGAFSLAVLLLLIGHGVNRTSRRAA